MRSSRALLIFALAAAGLAEPAQAGASATSIRQVTRVFYIQGMDSRDAMTLLRSQLQVRRMAMIGDRSVIVVSEVADRVDRSESLLRERDAVIRVTDPHEPLELEHPADSPPATRVFRVDSASLSTVVTLLRSIYQVREVSELAEGPSVSARAAQPILDSSEALLRELDLLVERAKED